MRPVPSLLCLLAPLTLLGCGTPGHAFHGVYEVRGEAHYSIPGVGNASFPVLDTIHVSEGTTSDLVLTGRVMRCVLFAQVEGEVATLSRGASCSWSEHGIPFVLTLSGGKFSRLGTGGRFDMAGSVTATVHGELHTGPFFQKATLARIGG